MNLNFELVLFYGTIITGAISLFDFLFLANRRRRAHPGVNEIKLPILVDYAQQFARQWLLELPHQTFGAELILAFFR